MAVPIKLDPALTVRIPPIRLQLNAQRVLFARAVLLGSQMLGYRAPLTDIKPFVKLGPLL